MTFKADSQTFETLVSFLEEWSPCSTSTQFDVELAASFSFGHEM